MNRLQLVEAMNIQLPNNRAKPGVSYLTVEDKDIYIYICKGPLEYAVRFSTSAKVSERLRKDWKKAAESRVRVATMHDTGLFRGYRIGLGVTNWVQHSASAI